MSVVVRTCISYAPPARRAPTCSSRTSKSAPNGHEMVTVLAGFPPTRKGDIPEDRVLVPRRRGETNRTKLRTEASRPDLRRAKDRTGSPRRIVPAGGKRGDRRGLGLRFRHIPRDFRPVDPEIAVGAEKLAALAEGAGAGRPEPPRPGHFRRVRSCPGIEVRPCIHRRCRGGKVPWRIAGSNQLRRGKAMMLS